ncbi:MAG TPA: hypothetical protein VK104_05080 [Burkholderiaceae bacterium]|nr:hypothetical protein [Burkholderiaceae bacterium]
MCGMCGTPVPPPRWFMVGVADTPADTMRERVRQVGLLSEHLSPLRIRVHASPSTPGLTLQTPDGRSEFITDLGDVWPAVERLGGHAYDPLLSAGAGRA